MLRGVASGCGHCLCVVDGLGVSRTLDEAATPGRVSCAPGSRSWTDKLIIFSNATYWFLRLKRPRDLCLRFEPVAFEPSDAAQVGGASAGTVVAEHWQRWSGPYM